MGRGNSAVLRQGASYGSGGDCIACGAARWDGEEGQLRAWVAPALQSLRQQQQQQQQDREEEEQEQGEDGGISAAIKVGGGDTLLDEGGGGGGGGGGEEGEGGARAQPFLDGAFCLLLPIGEHVAAAAAAAAHTTVIWALDRLCSWLSRQGRRMMWSWSWSWP